MITEEREYKVAVFRGLTYGYDGNGGKIRISFFYEGGKTELPYAKGYCNGYFHIDNADVEDIIKDYDNIPRPEDYESVVDWGYDFEKALCEIMMQKDGLVRERIKNGKKYVITFRWFDNEKPWDPKRPRTDRRLPKRQFGPRSKKT